MKNKMTRAELVADNTRLRTELMQAVANQAMSESNLREQIETEKQSAEYWKAEANRLANAASKTEVDLRQSRGFVAKQEQVVRELGIAIGKLGECIAHL